MATSGDWKLATDSEPYLTSVSCTSSSFCVALDSGNAIIYNGTDWSSPQWIDPDFGLDSVSCVSVSFCVTTGTSGDVTIANS